MVFSKLYLVLCWGDVRTWLSQVSWYVIPELIAKVWFFSQTSTWVALLDNGHGHRTNTSQSQIAPAHILWFGCSWIDTEDRRRFGSSSFTCRALTKAGDNFHPVLSTEELSQNPNDAQPLSCWVILLPAPGWDQAPRGWSGPHSAVSLANGLQTNWWQHCQRWWSHIVWSAINPFPASRCQPTGQWGGGRGDRGKQMLFAPFPWDVIRIFFLVLLRIKSTKFEPWGKRDGAEQTR